MPSIFRSLSHPSPLPRIAVVLLGALLSSGAAHAEDLANLRPAWLESYQIWSGRADLGNPNLSYLQNPKSQVIADGPVVNQFGSLIDDKRAGALRQQYDDLNRDYDQKQRAGLANSTVEQAHQGAVTGFSNGVLDDIEKRKLQDTGDKAANIIVSGADQTTKTIMTPGVVVAGVYVGKTVNVRMTDDSHFSFRTSLRDKLGQIELHSPILYGSFEFHPQAPDSYTLINSGNVDFGHMMDFNHLADFGAERYQFKVVRSVPFLDMSSSVLYGSSSNVVASSLSKQLTPHLAAVVDSVYYLTPYDPDHTIEERVRLRYDLHF